MDLLQYLIAPHEQHQQPPPGITSSSINHEQSQQTQQPTTPIITKNLYQQSRSQDLTQITPYAQAPASMPVRRRHAASSYTHSPVSSSLYAESSDGDETSQHQLPQQQQQQSQTSEILDREQLIRGLSAHPDVLASLLRNGGLAGLTTTLQNSQQTIALTDYRNESPSTTIRLKTPQETPTVATVEIRQICFWWYHNGHCNKDPQSSSFNGTQDHCRYIHYLTNADDMINVTQQHFPGYWHRKGDCGLERCRFSSTYRHLSRPFQKQKKDQQQSQSPASSSQQSYSPPSAQSAGHSYGQMRGFNAINAPNTPTSTIPTVPTGPAADRRGRKQNQRQQHQQYSSESPIPTPTLKRKASALYPPVDPATLPIPTGPSAATALKLTPSQHKRAAKHARKKAKLALIPLTSPKYFDVVSSLTPAFPPHTDTPAKKKTQTCFLWYHGACDSTGPKCHLLHALVEGYVQPPRGYVHREVCAREWCPGDWMWEHEGGMAECERPVSEPYGQVEEDEDEVDEDGKDENEEDGEDDVIMEEGDIDVELSHEEGEIDGVDGEWYMEGFADI